MDAEHSRNHTARPGCDLVDAIALPGWEHESIWGWDEGVGSFYAQLWRNGNSLDGPEIWLSGAHPPYRWPECLALAIVLRTHGDALTVVHAMGIADPDPALLPDDVIAGKAAELAGLNDHDGWIDGRRHALAWVQGQVDVTPGTRITWCRGERPTPAQVDAEQHIVTGRRRSGEYGLDGPDFFAGVDESLRWVLGR